MTRRRAWRAACALGVMAVALASAATAAVPVPTAPRCVRITVQARSPRHPALAGRHALRPHAVVEAGTRIAVPPHGWLRLRRRGVTYRLRASHVVVRCGVIELERGSAAVSVGRSPPHGPALTTPEARLAARRPGTRADVSVGRRTRAWVRHGALRVGSLEGPVPVLDAAPGDVVVVERSGVPRLDTWPFGRSAGERRATAADHLPRFWGDGTVCATGCRAPGAIAGWPLRPFHRQHALRSGLNELRTSSLHHGIAYVTVLGTVKNGFGHLHLSEVAGDRYLNPLRPGGRILRPWRDTEPPVIGMPELHAGGTATVQVFDPQSFRILEKYRTPVMAPAALAYRALDGSGHALTPLRFALRGSQNLPFSAASAIYAGDSYAPGFTCFDRRLVCIPRWDYRLAGGLAPALPAATRALVVYAWDWEGNVEVRRASAQPSLRVRLAAP